MKDEVIGREADADAPSFSSFILPPSSFPRVPLAVPYWNRATYQTILHCLITGRVIEGAQLGNLKAQIVETVGVTDALLCGSGSLALELALRACAVRGGDEVVLPTFCCTAVVPPIVAVGATPVLADIGDELNLTVETVQAALTQKTKAVIVPHLFGNPAEIERIIELVRGRNICVIDDAAQALGAKINGQPVGSFGDAGVLSFGAEKVCFGLGGGVAMSRNNSTAGQFSRSNLSRPCAAAIIENLFSTITWRRLRRWTGPFCSLLSPESVAPDAAPIPYHRESMSNLAAAVASSLMRALGENISARRARVEAYGESLENCPGIEVIAHRRGSACLTQVIRILPKHRDDDAASRVIAALRAAGYEVQGSYMPIHHMSSFNHCVWDRLPHADRVWADLVELPCEPSVSLIDIERIAELVKNEIAQ
ncbi:MAG TPA: aminotransferase class V-fold PLP-dependent enzyme [Candidatus Limnocylindrales bacterium]|nr:aminotransferase class V-fold PLP-dependent enzyme [Candidatus Limnocylindrales bacterium]